ncbi:hypothetical protein CWI36_0286p0020 [Hamiltosporidium magnivora]|uniref:Uncharacterized protein n=1 Tax=Hamiltosporidium magnivora TaxID=148818 RepID=A0A4Q9LJA7_9MICR|nr:hypothetical protein CWI36_0286p0020 [Hamiltosporidium magnivora]
MHPSLMKGRIFLCFINIFVTLSLLLQIVIIIFIWINIRSICIIGHLRQEMMKLQISNDSLAKYFIQNDSFLLSMINLNNRNVCLLVPIHFTSDYYHETTFKDFLKKDHEYIHKTEVNKIVNMINGLDLKGLKEVILADSLYRNEFLIGFIKKYFYYELPCYKYIKFYEEVSKVFTYSELNTINIIYFTTKSEINIEKIKIKIKKQPIYLDHVLRVDDIKKILNNPDAMKEYENFRKNIANYRDKKHKMIFDKIIKRQAIGYEKLCNLYVNLGQDIKNVLIFGQDFMFPNCADSPSNFVSKIKCLKRKIRKVIISLQIKPFTSSFSNQETLNRICSDIRILSCLINENSETIAYLALKSSNKLSSLIDSIKRKLDEFNNILNKYFFKYKKIYDFVIQKELIAKALYLFLKKNCEIQPTNHNIQIKYPEETFFSLWLRYLFN